MYMDEYLESMPRFSPYLFRLIEFNTSIQSYLADISISCITNFAIAFFRPNQGAAHLITCHFPHNYFFLSI